MRQKTITPTHFLNEVRNSNEKVLTFESLKFVSVLTISYRGETPALKI